MIRSVKQSTKYANTNKIFLIADFVEDFSKTTLDIIYAIFTFGYINSNKKHFNFDKGYLDLDSNLDNEYLKQFNQFGFTQRMMQNCGTQASSIIRSCTEKQRKREYVIREIMKKGNSVSKLQRITHTTQISIPDFELINPQLDGRFFDIRKTDGHFDYFIQFRLYEKQDPIRIPVKASDLMKNFEECGMRNNSILLNKNYVSLSYEIPDVPKKEEGRKVGADQGISTVLTLSDGQVTCMDKDFYDLSSILQRMQRRKYGSKGFKRTQTHRMNHINWAINQLDFSGINHINLEELIQMRKGKSNGKFLNRFTYTLIKKKLVSTSETEGFEIVEVSNEFRSQRCSECGWTQKSNRKGKVFKCKKCRFCTDADLNASLNLLADALSRVPMFIRLGKYNRKGFYWNPDGCRYENGELIVPHVQEMFS